MVSLHDVVLILALLGVRRRGARRGVLEVTDGSRHRSHVRTVDGPSMLRGEADALFVVVVVVVVIVVVLGGCRKSPGEAQENHEKRRATRGEFQKLTRRHDVRRRSRK